MNTAVGADERLVVMLEARISEFEKRMRQAEGTGTRSYTRLRSGSRSATRQMEADMTRSAGRINDALAGVSRSVGAFRGALAGGAVAAAAASYLKLADAATKMRNSLRVAGLDGDDLTNVYGKLYQSAQRNAAPIGSLVDLYSKLALTQKELGVSSDELIRFTDGIAVALKVAGTDATSASGSLLQLSQALGGGIVRAEEFNSILEGTPTIAQAVARGLKEANGSVAELRKLVVDGQVSSTAFFRAFQVGSEELRRQAETSQSTVGQAFTRLGNSVVDVVGKFDDATGASSHFADAIGDVADWVGDFDAQALINQLYGIARAFEAADEAGRSWLNNVGNADIFAKWNEFTGATEGGQFVNPEIGEAEAKIETLERLVEGLQTQIESDSRFGIDTSAAVANLAAVRAELAALRAEAANIPRYVADLRTRAPVVGPAPTTTGAYYDGSGYQPPPSAPQPVSIADHPAAPSKPSGGGGGRKRGGGGGGRAREKKDDFAETVEDIRERTAALEAEAASLVLVATSGEDYGDALEYARKRAELLHAAQKAGKTITPELAAEIDQLAQAYATAGLKAEEAAEKMQEIEAATERGKDALGDMFGSIIDGSSSAKDAILKLVAEIAKVQVMKGLMAMPGMGGAASLLGNLLSFDGGGYTGNAPRSGGLDGKGGFLAVMHPRETVMDHTKGGGGGQSGGGEMSVHVTVGVDPNTGNLTAFVDKRAGVAAQTMGKHVLQLSERSAVDWVHNSRKRRY